MHIEQTILSVVSQSVLQDRTNKLFYIIKDGGSTDATVDKAKAIAYEYCKKKNITIQIISETDTGMYDALATSFKGLPKGDVFSYINAGDYYSLWAFEIVAEIFMNNDVHFLTGLSCVYNEKNHLLRCSLPFKYERSLLLAGYYGTILPHVQQESTFWSLKLHETLDLNSLKKTRLAGDYLLWKTFITYEKLYIVSAYLGGFKIHKGQLTENSLKQYKKELRELAERGSLFTLLSSIIYRICWQLPNRLKKRLSGQIFDYDYRDKEYRISN